MSTSEAIEEFRNAAISKGDSASPPCRDHALHKRMAASFHFLSSTGPEGITAFHALLKDESPHVRGWVAAQLLSQGDKSAVPAMKKLSDEPGIRGFTAQTTLKEFLAGRLRSPFSNHDA